MASTSTRLRKTFKYPSDDEHSTSSHDELDEEEQEKLISNLQSQSQISNATYTIIFTILPLLLTPLFTYHLLFNSSLPARLRFLSLLALTSLLASSFAMFFLSSTDTTDARARLDKRQRQTNRRTFKFSTQTPSSSPSTAPSIPILTTLTTYATALGDKLDDIRLDLDPEGPLLKALPLLNYVMSGLLAVAAWALKGRVMSGVPEYMWVYFLVPPVMAGMTAVARRAIMDEERGLRELGGLTYGYKGA